jgi:hypothetical protein
MVFLRGDKVWDENAKLEESVF